MREELAVALLDGPQQKVRHKAQKKKHKQEAKAARARGLSSGLRSQNRQAACPVLDPGKAVWTPTKSPACAKRDHRGSGGGKTARSG